MFPQPNQRNQFMSTRTEDQNPLLPVKLKPVDMQKGAGSRPFPKPLMVKPNFTVNSLETRFNPPVFSNGPNIVSRRDAVGATLPNREQHENSYAETPSSGAWTPIKPSVLQKHLFHKDISAGPGTTEDLSVPKTKPLPNVFALGKCPAKPERPPHVNLNKFRGNAGSSVSNINNPEFDPGIFPLPPPPEECLSITSMTPPPPPPECLSITSMTPPPPPNFTLPPPMDQTFQEDLYDDTDTMNRTPSSLGKSSNDREESGEEIYEDLDHNQPEDNKETTTKGSKELKKKLEKEEKKRLEQEKKEKKEREKRQQEAKKKFKIKDMTAVVDTVKARVDHKGGKNKLPLKQGETIEIVRKTENPKDYWLARNTEGHYGFVKPDTLDVRGEVRHTHDGQEVYDDVGAGDELNSLPDAVECDDDIYAECAEDAQADLSFLPPPPPADFEFNVVADAADGAYDDTYDDVTASDFPPPPSPCSNRKCSSSSETNVMDPKKKKKFEKEEKEFRKKFKYNAEIRVLYQATVLPSLSMKKFGNKDLPIKPGEMIDVIVHPVDGKLICRNSEGKFGYVSTANLEQDGSVYDDVGNVTECIYDND
ncbi:FYN-binding protein 1 isoform X1 [Pimephales promelas]|uniref:FYN-binding protein 1 isoform X1 n=1 Tax=Pimephales promelas TaxID=90988 RepID=UPI001955EF91|nr:FYN-binding protein 1 isoform X1 [Pimephales promelas]XP_039514276.1 FYN-binding protein 1 isoform X1 [Pimephales promelas]